MSESDQHYIECCLNGHSDDFRYLVRRYEAVLMAYLTGELRNRTIAEEAAQETFVRAYFGLDKLRKRQSFYSWLLGIAKRVAKEQQRSRNRHCELNDSLPEKAPAAEHSTDFALQRAIAELPATYRELILLRYYGGRSCSQIAGQLDIPIGTVTKTLSRAYGKLRESLRKKDIRNNEVQK